MRRTRLVGIVVAAGAVVVLALALAPAVRGQAKAAGQDARSATNFALAVDPDVQWLDAGGPQIGVNVHDGEKGEGVIVNDVRGESPAAKAGVKAGDVISEFDGEKVRSARQLTRLVQETPAGRSVKMAVVRDGKRVELTVAPEAGGGAVWNEQLRGDMGRLTQDLQNNLRSLPRQGDRFQQGDNMFQFRSPGSGGFELVPPEGGSGPWEFFVQPSGRLGVTAQDLTEQLATYFGAKRGVLVTSVTEGSVAAKAGLKAGDVITAVNDHAVETSSDLVRVVREAGSGADLTLAIVRDRKPMTVKAKLEAPASSPRIIRRAVII
jgi:serine protease Do